MAVLQTGSGFTTEDKKYSVDSAHLTTMLDSLTTQAYAAMLLQEVASSLEKENRFNRYIVPT